MSLETVERTLARLYTDDGFRERFFADPRAAGDEAGLSEEEVARIVALDRSRVEMFADSLRRKRFGEVRALLPHLVSAAGETEVGRLFEEFARSFVPEGVRKHHADALAFAAWVERRVDGAAREGARYERARLGLFYRLEGREAVARRGPAIALVRHHGRRRLLLRSRNAERFFSIPVLR